MGMCLAALPGIAHDTAIRQRPNVLTWVFSLQKLRKCGGSPATVIKKWDQREHLSDDALKGKTVGCDQPP